MRASGRGLRLRDLRAFGRGARRRSGGNTWGGGWLPSIHSIERSIRASVGSAASTPGASGCDRIEYSNWAIGPVCGTARISQPRSYLATGPGSGNARGLLDRRGADGRGEACGRGGGNGPSFRRSSRARNRVCAAPTRRITSTPIGVTALATQHTLQIRVQRCPRYQSRCSTTVGGCGGGTGVWVSGMPYMDRNIQQEIQIRKLKNLWRRNNIPSPARGEGAKGRVSHKPATDPR